MKPAKSPTALKVLSVSPIEEDHLSLHTIVSHSVWKLFSADSIPAALTILLDEDISVIICERDLSAGVWSDLLESTTKLPQPPSLIVTSRLADDRLWAEALNLGAWDVLAKPFDRIEVLRSIKTAWQHWHDQIQVAGTPTKVIVAAS
jgi:DNA-binding NtrC family response regulator